MKVFDYTGRILVLNDIVYFQKCLINHKEDQKFKLVCHKYVWGDLLRAALCSISWKDSRTIREILDGKPLEKIEIADTVYNFESVEFVEGEVRDVVKANVYTSYMSYKDNKIKIISGAGDGTSTLIST